MNPRKRVPVSALPPRDAAADLRGVGQLAIAGVHGVTDLVEAMHAAITHLPALTGNRAPASTQGLTALVYDSVRGITRLVGSGIDTSFGWLGTALGQVATSAEREAVISALNGVLGDHLEHSSNPLAIQMRLRVHGQALPLTRAALSASGLLSVAPQCGGKLLLLVHGLCMNDLQWNQGGHDHGQALARSLGYTPLYLHYNSGRHLSTNGQALCRLIAQLVKAWPVPVEEIVLLGHSMGGMVARSALDHAFRRRLAWSKLPLQVVFLGVPQHGAPLERAGDWVDRLIGFSPYSAPFVRLGQLRSAGIQDLRHGSLRDADWQTADQDNGARPAPLPLPRPVTAYAIAACTRREEKLVHGLPIGSDGLVPVASALGRHPDPAYDLGIAPTRQWIGYGTDHLQLLGSEAVCRRIERWLRRPPSDS